MIVTNLQSTVNIDVVIIISQTAGIPLCRGECVYVASPG